MSACLLLGLFLAAPHLKVAPVWGQGLRLPGPLNEGGLYLKVLSATLPGFKSLQEEPAVSPLQLVQRTLVALVDVDPYDPRTFLSSPIYGLYSPPEIGPPREADGDQESPPDAYPALLPSQGHPFQGGDLNAGIFIYHAHTTESFVPTSGVRFTTDLNQTVALLGQELKLLLQTEYGIPVYHDVTIHDIPRSKAYQEARVTASRRLADMPEVRLVVDLHRDGVARSVTTARIGGQDVGKILLVAGTNHKESAGNLMKARTLHENLERIAPGISRGIRERNLVYNQDLHPGALLVEVGGHENSLEEARRTLPYLAQALAELLYQLP